jgi:hypothetical protein
MLDEEEENTQLQVIKRIQGHKKATLTCCWVDAGLVRLWHAIRMAWFALAKCD